MANRILHPGRHVHLRLSRLPILRLWGITTVEPGDAEEAKGGRTFERRNRVKRKVRVYWLKFGRIFYGLEVS